MRDFANFSAPKWLSQLPTEACLSLVLGILLALIGPYNTFAAPLLARLGYWTGLCVCWFALSDAVALGLSFTRLVRLRRWQRKVIHILLASAVVTLLVWPATFALRGVDLMAREPYSLYLRVLVIATGVSMVLDAVLARFPSNNEPQPGGSDSITASGAIATLPSAGAACRLLERLPHHNRGPIKMLEMEDHYVRVHTANGSALVLMRFGDAIAELDGTPGERVHRSWWVAAGTPCEFRRNGRVGILELSDATAVPVSTPYLGIAERLAAAQA